MFFFFKRFYRLYAVLLVSLLCACDPTEPEVRQLVENTIRVHGQADYKGGVISFRSGEVLYRVLRHHDAFVYSRTFQDANGQRVHDVVQNSGFSRTINEQEEKLSPELNIELAAAVSREIFLALLPYNLNNPSVQQKYEGNFELKGQEYHKVRFTLPAQREIAGEKLELIGWFHKQQHTLDYVGFRPEKDGAVQFWEAKNPRKIGGIRFQDYTAYSTTDRISIERLDQAFDLGRLQQQSEIALTEIKTNSLPNP
ncbi:DUF6503 family protein [Pontibacter sp. 13R65]|uniref:DUF6503 family protein n=1 Tax=Pontibacter sp. 13R65 TaxID=3127458 RepID=UPI00301BCE51